MATTATASKLHMGDASGGIFMGIFELTLDTTDANGELTLDLTDYFSYIDAMVDGGSDGTTGYVAQFEKPADGTAITATNVKVGIYEAGADAGALDAVTSTDVSAYIPGLTVVVWGKAAV